MALKSTMNFYILCSRVKTEQNVAFQLFATLNRSAMTQVSIETSNHNKEQVSLSIYSRALGQHMCPKVYLLGEKSTNKFCIKTVFTVIFI